MIGLKLLGRGNGFVARACRGSFQQREATAGNTSVFTGDWLLVTICILISRHWMADSHISIIFIVYNTFFVFSGEQFLNIE